MIESDHQALLFTQGENKALQISGNFSISGVDATRANSRASAISAAHAETKSSLSMPVDQLDLSPEAMALSNSDSVTEVFRADKVASMREAIANGSYDTEEKLNAALEILLDRLG
jgi:anti-sigma28 factor (negative regulator of flagellin synthesis)